MFKNVPSEHCTNIFFYFVLFFLDSWNVKNTCMYRRTSLTFPIRKPIGKMFSKKYKLLHYFKGTVQFLRICVNTKTKHWQLEMWRKFVSVHLQNPLISEEVTRTAWIPTLATEKSKFGFKRRFETSNLLLQLKEFMRNIMKHELRIYTNDFF